MQKGSQPSAIPKRKSDPMTQRPSSGNKKPPNSQSSSFNRKIGAPTNSRSRSVNRSYSTANPNNKSQQQYFSQFPTSTSDREAQDWWGLANGGNGRPFPPIFYLVCCPPCAIDHYEGGCCQSRWSFRAWASCLGGYVCGLHLLLVFCCWVPDQVARPVGFSIRSEWKHDGKNIMGFPNTVGNVVKAVSGSQIQSKESATPSGAAKRKISVHVQDEWLETSGEF